MQFRSNVPWIPMLNINYHMGVDGLSVPLIFLTTFLTTLGLYYSARVDQGAGAGVLLPLPAAGNGHARRLRLARPGAVLRLLGDRPGADVLPDRHLGPGEGPAAVLGHQVLPLHAGRLGLHAAGHPGHLLHHRHVSTSWRPRGCSRLPATSCCPAWPSGPSSSPSPSRCRAGRSTPGCPTPTPPRRRPARSSWPASC